MSPELSKTSAQKTKWLHDEVLDLLCTLNLNIEFIRLAKADPTDKEMRGVIEHAVSFLSRKVSFVSSPKRIQTKLASLWKNCGTSDGAGEPYALYQNGAFSRTLPGLDDPKKGFPGMLRQIAVVLDNQQSDMLARAKDANQGQRRSQRQGVRDDSHDPIVCRCDFSHNIATVQCAECLEWQHTLCYYNTSNLDEIPVKHMCDECNPDASCQNKRMLDEEAIEALLISLNNLEVTTSGDPWLSHQQRLEADLRVEHSVSGLKFPEEKATFLGPTDPEIQTTMLRIQFKIEELVYHLLELGVSKSRLRGIFKGNSGECEDIVSLLNLRHGTKFSDRIVELLRGPIQSSFGVAQLMVGLVSSIVFERTFYCNTMSGSVAYLYKPLCQNIFEIGGIQALRYLHRKSILDVLKADPESRVGGLEAQAEAIAISLRNELRHLLTGAGPPSPLYTQTASQQALVDIIKVVTLMCLKLKLRLMLSEKLYAISTIPIGTNSSSRKLFDRAGGRIGREKVVKICLMPEIVEHDPENHGRRLEELLMEPNSSILVSAAPDDGPEAAIVSPAIISLFG